ncbi:hypothetical protein L2E82_47173 [Cichorium intybus]|uniref:Uncharacterized protein n=1 Tax=Cichorium intybus TaxID=13427 RepID=A0ACB8YVW6_CICIN|nr:hypothetical protein L2E82_47173 [Cichorium intybus]
MATGKLFKLVPTFTILIVILSRTNAASELALSLPGCPDKCGDITIPYPFGTKEGCYLSEKYHVNCSTGSFSITKFKPLNISLEGYMRGLLPISYRCYDKSYKVTSSAKPKIQLSRFCVSSTQNLLTVVGFCLGRGCSQVPVPPYLTRFRIHTQSNTRGENVGNWNYNNCTYAFVVEKGKYTFRKTDFNKFPKRAFPVVLEWSIDSITCDKAQMNRSAYVCRENSVCLDTLTETNRTYWGYRCKCAQGYEGNPYLPNGCQDIDECELAQHDCKYDCINTNGSYNCSCPSGKRGDGRKDGNGCSNYIQGFKLLGDSVYWGISMGTLASFFMTFIIWWALKQRQIMKSRERFFKKNGGLILQKVLFESKKSAHMTKVFAARDLEKATNKFHKTNIVGQGGYGTVYKGTLGDKTTVAIKKAKSIDESQIEQFINEVIILSEVSHPNVVKLLGCCLETQTPLLVYEFVSNKTIFHHLHEQDYISSMTFERRLNIATQTAEALAHIHSTTQIVHRDIKSLNILLTDDYIAKVSDFGISRFIPVDETHLQTLVHGTLGYIDPEYFRSGILTEKSDVYSFGMVLVELLTGRKVFSHDRTESDLGLATYFTSSLERGHLLQILDDKVKKDGLNEYIRYFARIAKDCVELEGKKRPNMVEVQEELEELRQSFLKSSIVYEKIKYIDFDEILSFH